MRFDLNKASFRTQPTRLLRFAVYIFECYFQFVPSEYCGDRSPLPVEIGMGIFFSK